MEKKLIPLAVLLAVVFPFLFTALKLSGNAYVPLTGDDSHTVLWLVVFAVSLVVLIFTIRGLYKNRPIK